MDSVEMPSPDAVEFAGWVLNHCALIADLHRDGELICPFVVLMDSNGMRSVEFESETQVEAIDSGWASLEESRRRGEWWAFGREGLRRTKDGALDVLMVTVWTPVQSSPITIMQTFGRFPDNSFYLIGLPYMTIGERNSVQDTIPLDTASLMRGIASHPDGANWSRWKKQ